MDGVGNINNCEKWFALRDLKRSNALLPAYIELQNEGFEVFTPLHWCLKNKKGKKVRVQVPYIRDLLFVKSSKSGLDTYIKYIPTLQYRFRRGGAYCEPIVVPDEDMNRFIRAVNSTESPVYFLPEEISPSMCSKTIKIIGGPLDGYLGRLLTVRGSKKKRLLVDIPDVISAGIEVSPDFIEFI